MDLEKALFNFLFFLNFEVGFMFSKTKYKWAKQKDQTTYPYGSICRQIYIAEKRNDTNKNYEIRN